MRLLFHRAEWIRLLFSGVVSVEELEFWVIAAVRGLRCVGMLWWNGARVGFEFVWLDGIYDLFGYVVVQCYDVDLVIRVERVSDKSATSPLH